MQGSKSNAVLQKGFLGLLIITDRTPSAGGAAKEFRKSVR